MAQQKMYFPQKWVHSIVMLGAKLRSTCSFSKNLHVVPSQKSSVIGFSSKFRGISLLVVRIICLRILKIIQDILSKPADIVHCGVKYVKLFQTDH